MKKTKIILTVLSTVAALSVAGCSVTPGWLEPNGSAATVPADTVAEGSGEETMDSSAVKVDDTEKNTDELTETGETGDVTESTEEDVSDQFYITPITDEIFARIEGKSFKDDCTLSRDDLRYLHVLHKDLEGNVHEGEMIVNYHIAEDVLDILKQLYEADYPIEKIRLVDEYDADDIV